MEKEFNYGNGTYNRNDRNASGKSFPSTNGLEEKQQVGGHPETKEHIDFNNSNRRYDNYFLHFSSKL